MALRPWLQLIRVQNLPTALADVWAGYAIGWMVRTERPLVLWPAEWMQPQTLIDSGGWRQVVLISLASVGFYAGGLVLNDYADRDRDRLLHPSRPIPSGQVSPNQALLLGVLLMGFGGMAVFDALVALLVPLLLVFCVVGYDFLFKSDPFLGSAALGLARGLNWFLGAAASYNYVETYTYAMRQMNMWNGYMRPSIMPSWDWFSGAGAYWFIPLGLSAYAAAVTLASTAEESQAGRRLRIAVSTTVLATVILAVCAGAENLWVGPYATLAALYPTEAAYLHNRDLAVAWSLAGLLTVLVLVNGWRATTGNSPDGVRRLVLIGVRGYVVLDAIVVLAWGSPQAAGAILGLLVISMLLGMLFRGS